MGGNPVSKNHVQPSVWGMSRRLTRAGPSNLSPVTIFPGANDYRKNVIFSFSDVHEQDWQRHPVDPYSAESVDHVCVCFLPIHSGHQVRPYIH